MRGNRSEIGNITKAWICQSKAEETRPPPLPVYHCGVPQAVRPGDFIRSHGYLIHSSEKQKTNTSLKASRWNKHLRGKRETKFPVLVTLGYFVSWCLQIQSDISESLFPSSSSCSNRGEEGAAGIEDCGFQRWRHSYMRMGLLTRAMFGMMELRGLANLEE